MKQHFNYKYFFSSVYLNIFPNTRYCTLVIPAIYRPSLQLTSMVQQKRFALVSNLLPS